MPTLALSTPAAAERYWPRWIGTTDDIADIIDLAIRVVAEAAAPHDVRAKLEITRGEATEAVDEPVTWVRAASDADIDGTETLQLHVSTLDRKLAATVRWSRVGYAAWLYVAGADATQVEDAVTRIAWPLGPEVKVLAMSLGTKRLLALTFAIGLVLPLLFRPLVWGRSSSAGMVVEIVCFVAAAAFTLFARRGSAASPTLTLTTPGTAAMVARRKRTTLSVAVWVAAIFIGAMVASVLSEVLH